jgi:PAS domain S-box-containing protein
MDTIPPTDSERNLALIKDAFDQSNDALFVIRPDTGELIDVNEKACTSLGYSREELLGLPVHRIETHLADLSHWLEHAREVKEKGAVMLFGEQRRKDGSVFPVEANVKAINFEKKSVLIAVVRDLTRRRQVEQVLRESEAQLREQSERLVRSNQELTRFAAIAAHDLQEPVRMVASFCTLIQQKHRGKLDAETDQWLEFARDGAERMKELIQRLLEYSRVGSQGPQWERVDCNRVLATVLMNLSTAIQEAGAEVKVEPLPVLRGDHVQFGQLFQNLLSNALKFRGSSPCRVKVSAEKQGDEWRFAIEDNGIGIAPEDQGRAFTPFLRLNPRGKYPGSGLGLSICKKIVDKFGGGISFESELGKGSKFTIVLPA